jgi:myo-inositol 2-dehydrogenase/D-chiro-inositol 1-dehydrogenase
VVKTVAAMQDDPIPTVLFSGVRHARNYARLVESHSDFALVGVYESPDAPEWALDAARRLAIEFDVPRVDASAGEGLAIVCSEPTRHAACALKALASGRHVLIDKPAATSVDDARAIRAAAERRRLVCTSVNRTLLSSIQRARSIVDAGHIGFPRSIDVEFLADGAQFATAVERPELVVDATLSGGGELMNFMGYCVDTIRVVTGCDPIETFGLSASAFSAVHRAAGAEDIGAVSMLFTNGLVATITVGRVPAAPSAGAGASSIRVVGSHGHLLIDDSKPAVTVNRASGARDEIRSGPDAETEAFSGILDDLRDATLHERPLRYSIDDAVIAIAAIEATYESIRTGRPVAIVQ